MTTRPTGSLNSRYAGNFSLHVQKILKDIASGRGPKNYLVALGQQVGNPVSLKRNQRECLAHSTGAT